MEPFQAKLAELEAHFTGHWLTDMANFSAFVFHSLPDLNWAGFYLFNGEKLILGPFMGKPACTEIRPGRGVCGTAFERRKAIIVPDVNNFPGHITCDSASRSELVLPITLGDDCVGVLDIDSPSLDRFRDSDLAGLKTWLSALEKRLPAGLAAKKPWA